MAEVKSWAPIGADAMARQQEPASTPTLTEQIEAAIATLREKRQQARALERQAADLAGEGATEGSIEAEARAAAIAKFCVRQKAIIEEKIRARHAEQLQDYLKRIDELYAGLVAQAKATAAQLKKAGQEVHEAVLRMREITGGGVSGAEVLRSVPITDFSHQIAEDLGGALTGLSRAIFALRKHAQDSQWFPGGPQGVTPYDGAMFNSLRTALGADLSLDQFDLEEELEPEPVAVAATH